MTDVGFVAARPNFVIVSQIDIEDQLFRYGAESRGFAEGFTIPRVRTVDRTDFKTGRIKP